jgi:hypothetical protein
MEVEPEATVDDGSGATIALLVARRAVLLERAALAAHDAVAADGVPFGSVREAVNMALDALEDGLRDPRREEAAAVPLGRRVARAVAGGLPLASALHGLHGALGSVLQACAGVEARAAVELVGASGRLVERVAAAAVAEVEAAHRAILRRRAAQLDQMREAAGALAAASVDVDGALAQIARTTAETLRCDWGAVALPEADGRLVIAAAVGRGSGFVQRWTLRVADGFAGAALESDHAWITTDPAEIPYEGEERPEAVIAVALRDAAGTPVGLVFCGRDGGEPLGSDEVALADGVAEIAGRVLAAARSSTGARRLSEQVALLRRAGDAALAGDEGAALSLLAFAASGLAGGEVALVRLLDPRRNVVVTRAVHADSPALAAELAGRATPAAEGVLPAVLAGNEVNFEEPLWAQGPGQPEAASAFGVPIRTSGRPRGLLEVVRRSGEMLADAERELVRLAASLCGLYLALGERRRTPSAPLPLRALGDALVAGVDAGAVARAAARHAQAAIGAQRAIVYVVGPDGPALAGAHGPVEEPGTPGVALAVAALRHDQPTLTGGDAEGVSALAGAGSPVVLSLPLRSRGRAVGVLQLSFGDREAARSASASAPLIVFASRTADALRQAAEHAEVEDRVRASEALLEAVAPRGTLTASGIVDAAIALTGADVAGLCARESDGSLRVLHEHELPDEAPALGAAMLDDSGERPRVVSVSDLAADARLATRARESGLGSAVAAALRHGDETLGVFVVGFKEPGDRSDAAEIIGRLARPAEAALAASELAAEAARLQVRATELGRGAAERDASLAAFEAVARAALSGEARDEALAGAVAGMTGAAGVAVQRLVEGVLTPTGLHVAPGSHEEPVRRVLERGLPLSDDGVRRALEGEAVVLGTRDDGGPLGPFLRTGSSAALVPLGLAGQEGLIVLVSLDPGRPVSAAAADRAMLLAAL